MRLDEKWHTDKNCLYTSMKGRRTDSNNIAVISQMVAPWSSSVCHSSTNFKGYFLQCQTPPPPNVRTLKSPVWSYGCLTAMEECSLFNGQIFKQICLCHSAAKNTSVELYRNRPNWIPSNGRVERSWYCPIHRLSRLFSWNRFSNTTKERERGTEVDNELLLGHSLYVPFSMAESSLLLAYNWSWLFFIKNWIISKSCAEVAKFLAVATIVVYHCICISCNCNHNVNNKLQWSYSSSGMNIDCV